MSTNLVSVIKWEETLPQNTSIKVETNVSLDNGTSWQGWKEVVNGGSIPDMPSVLDKGINQVKLQVRATLQSNDMGATPELWNMKIVVSADKLVEVEYGELVESELAFNERMISRIISLRLR